MRAVHSVFEGAPASGEDFSNLSFRRLVNDPPKVQVDVLNMNDDVCWTGSTARQLAESLSGLPLPEDYALQELRCLTR